MSLQLSVGEGREKDINQIITQIKLPTGVIAIKKKKNVALRAYEEGIWLGQESFPQGITGETESWRSRKS